MNEWNQWLVISIIHLVDKSFLCIFSGPLLPAFYSGLLRLETASLSHLSELPLLWAKTSLTFLFSEPKLLSASNSLTYVFSSSLICLFSQALLLWANLFAELLPLQATPFSKQPLLWHLLSQLLLLWPLPSLSYFSELLLWATFSVAVFPRSSRTALSHKTFFHAAVTMHLATSSCIAA